MFREISASFRYANDRRLRRRLVAIYSLLIALNMAIWCLACGLFWFVPATLSLCAVAYGLGLRHAVDADHIAAIDNVTRKLMQQGKRPVAVGFFFSLGHSTVVILMCFLVALITGFMRTNFPKLQEVGSLIGTSVSATFLLLIALINFVIFVQIYQAFRAVRSGEIVSDHALQDLLDGRGLLARILRPMFRFVSKSWHMYPIGFLFGLGFDTASEVAILGIAATQAATHAAQQLPIWSILVFPLLFTAGMCLVDTTDGVVMLGAYGWAFVQPMRKLFYNMTITLVSFLIAFLIGGLEALAIIVSRWHLEGGVWAYVNAFSENSGALGYAIIGLLIASWLISAAIYRVANLERYEVATSQSPVEG
jgi:high-affinity nickel-transport protein